MMADFATFGGLGILPRRSVKDDLSKVTSQLTLSIVTGIHQNLRSKTSAEIGSL